MKYDDWISFVNSIRDFPASLELTAAPELAATVLRITKPNFSPFSPDFSREILKKNPNWKTMAPAFRKTIEYVSGVTDKGEHYVNVNFVQ